MNKIITISRTRHHRNTIPSRIGWTAHICLCVAYAGAAVGVLADCDRIAVADTTADSKNGASDSNVYRDLILADKPVGYWRFDDAKSAKTVRSLQHSPAAPKFDGTISGQLTLQATGPRPKEFPLFNSKNVAITLPGKSGFIRITDPGKQSPLDFDNGDAITIEAWVNPRQITHGGYYYIIGKGRTNNPKFAANNQNYAMRLAGSGGGAGFSFLFRSAGKDGDWHRWTSKTGFAIGDGWHHVAVTYEFGKPESLRGYIDGERVSGKWDMGGATDKAPVVDDDEVWIGSSLGGSAASTFNGGLDEVALYRTALSAKRVRARYKYVAPVPTVDLTKIPQDKVYAEVFEGLPDNKSWKFRSPKFIESFVTPAFAFVDVPNKYSPRGVKVDRSSPFLIRATGYVNLPLGQQRLLVRCRNASRLYLDGKQVAETAFHSIVGTAHGTVFKIDTSLAPNIRPLQRGDTETVVNVNGDGKPHLFRFEMIVGGRKHRPEFGETSVSISRPDEDFKLLSATLNVPLTDAGWPEFAAAERERLVTVNAERRRVAGTEETKYWDRRHQLARQVLSKSSGPTPPNASKSTPVNNDIDRFIGKRLEAAQQTASPLTNDFAFLRRVTLDTIGTVPTPDHIQKFQADKSPQRRARAIDRLLDDAGWADNWVGYWQDVLAENPNIVNPTLNNTGPFRWWIHESFLDNKPFDRFATELVLMEGSAYYGGPAGFAMATQNDAPMAAKAHIVGQAFLGIEMKCARCHDAPYHDFKQRDLFSLAAMLNRGSQQVPKTSTVPGTVGSNSLLIKVTLKPGESVAPEWSFTKIAPSNVPDGILRKTDDSREKLAALITSPHNRRFSRVIVNRLWKRYLGLGLVEPVDDWEHADPSHPELLDYLARELVQHNYDLKYVTRLILNSRTYQRVVRGLEAVKSSEPYLFASPVVRRMSAEQLIDSLFVASGKPLDAGQICIDIDTARNYTSSLNLGVATRAWHFTSLSNERDRPSLALPFAQPFVTALETFGWRSSRQNPISERDTEPTVLQPAILANGLVARRVACLSDDSALTELALKNQSLDRLLDQVYSRVLTRPPTDDERRLFVEFLEPGFNSRRVQPVPPLVKRPRLRRNMVSWSNHLDPEASVIKIELEAAVRRGDPPTARLTADWRERMEDMIWTLINSPEFVFLP